MSIKILPGPDETVFRRPPPLLAAAQTPVAYLKT